MTIEESTLDVCLFVDIFWLFTTPLYIYGFIKWQQFHRHFLIRKRFPIFTYCLAVAAILEQVFSTILCWSHYNNPNHELVQFLISCISAFTFAALSSVLYRTYLIYIRWKQLQHTVNDNNTSTSTSTSTSVPKSSYCFIFYILIGTISLIFKDAIWAGLVHFIWTSVAICGLVIIFIYKYKKVKEGIGLSLETIITESAIVITLILSQCTSFHPIFAHIIRYLYEISTVLWCLVPLYLTLYNIYKVEGTLNQKLIKKQRRSSLLSEITITLSAVDKNTKNSIGLNLDQPLCLFLEDQKNYKLYGQYLVYIFAIENLLFLERVSIFMEIVYGMMENSNVHNAALSTFHDSHSIEIAEVSLPKTLAMMPGLSVSNSNTISSIPRIKFVFLQSIYEEYTKLIKPTCNDDKSLEYYKPGMDLIVKKICDEFVENGGVHQVNISYETRKKIMELLMDKEYFQEYEHYIHLFDNAMVEIFQLNISLYKYKFKSYVQQHMDNSE